MGAQESKGWVELPAETPERQVHKRVGELKQLQDPRSPGTGPRTPIQMQEFEESPQNRELTVDIPDPRSPDVLIDRTPIIVKSRKNSKLISKKPTAATVEITEYLPLKEDRKIPQETTETVSPAAVLSKKDQARLLKKTISPGDFRRQRRVYQRQSVPQKLFTDQVAPAPRSPLTQRNSIELGETGLKKNKAEIATNYGSQYIERGSGKENAAMNAVF